MCSGGQEWCLALQLLLLPQLFLVTGIQAQPAHRVIAFSDSKVRLIIPNLEPGDYSQFTWIYNTNQKIVEWDVREKPTFFKDDFKARMHLDNNGTLYIDKIMIRDNGTYIVRMLDTRGFEQQRQITLEVHAQPEYRVTATAGQDVNLIIPNLEPGDNRKFTWIYDTYEKIVEWDLSKAPTFSQTKFKDRVYLHKNGTLHINNIMNGDNGTYLVQVLNEHGAEQIRQITLEVKDRNSGVACTATWLVIMVPVSLLFA